MKSRVETLAERKRLFLLRKRKERRDANNLGILDDSSAASYKVMIRYVAPGELGLMHRHAWRSIDKHGAINGLPRFAGHAFATDGILVAIRLADGQVAIGHLDSFEEHKPASEAKGNRRLSKLERLAAEFA